MDRRKKLHVKRKYFIVWKRKDVKDEGENLQ